jgi:hypothetical protein
MTLNRAFFHLFFFSSFQDIMSLRSWVRTPDERLQEQLVRRAMDTNASSKKRKHGEWSKWTPQKKMSLGRMVLSHGMLHTNRYVHLSLLPPISFSLVRVLKNQVPRSTLSDWAAMARARVTIQPVGRPLMLSLEEEAILARAIRYV